MLRDPLLARALPALPRPLARPGGKGDASASRGWGRAEDTAWFYLERLRDCRRQYLERWQGDLVGAFRSFQDDGVPGDHHLRGDPRAAAAHGKHPAGRARADFHRAGRLPGVLRARPGGHLAAGVRVRGRDRPGVAGGEPALVHPRRARADVRPAPAAAGDLRAVLHPGGAGGVLARPGIEPAGLERAARLSGRPGVPGFLPGHRLRAAAGRAGAGDRAGAAAQVHRVQVSPHHRRARRTRSITTASGRWRRRTRTRAIS